MTVHPPPSTSNTSRRNRRADAAVSHPGPTASCPARYRVTSIASSSSCLDQRPCPCPHSTCLGFHNGQPPFELRQFGVISVAVRDKMLKSLPLGSGQHRNATLPAPSAIRPEWLTRAPLPVVGDDQSTLKPCPAQAAAPTRSSASPSVVNGSSKSPAGSTADAGS